MKKQQPISKNKKPFTLIEVIAAISVLAVGIVGTMSVVVDYGHRMNRANERWHESHLLSQAAEFFLLAGNYENIPEIIFPYENFTASCTIQEPTDLPDNLRTSQGQWNLRTLKINILSKSQKIINSVNVDKIIYSNE